MFGNFVHVLVAGIIIDLGELGRHPQTTTLIIINKNSQTLPNVCMSQPLV